MSRLLTVLVLALKKLGPPRRILPYLEHPRPRQISYGLIPFPLQLCDLGIRRIKISGQLTSLLYGLVVVPGQDLVSVAQRVVCRQTFGKLELEVHYVLHGR